MHFRIYQDEHRRFRWRLLSDTNETVAHSADAYGTRNDCVRAIALIRYDVGQADVFDWSVDPVQLIRV